MLIAPRCCLKESSTALLGAWCAIRTWTGTGQVIADDQKLTLSRAWTQRKHPLADTLRCAIILFKISKSHQSVRNTAIDRCSGESCQGSNLGMGSLEYPFDRYPTLGKQFNLLNCDFQARRCWISHKFRCNSQKKYVLHNLTSFRSTSTLPVPWLLRPWLD